MDVDCAPCLDLRVDGADNVIGDRSFGADPARVSALGQANTDGFLAGGVLPVIKHMPGYGHVGTDPHHELPAINRSLNELKNEDLEPFIALNNQSWGMTAHAVYSRIDPDRPATLSPKVIEEVIRGVIGFDGVLVTDALDMEALKGSHAERARHSLDAGCDLAMHCNSSLKVRREVSDAVPEISTDARRRLAAAEAARQAPDPEFDRQAALGRLANLLGDIGL